MTSPGFVPGSVPPHTADTASQLKNLDKKIDSLGRKDLTRANVGQGGRLRGLYGNGSEAILFGVDPDDGANKSQIKYSDGVTAFSIAPGSAVYGGKEQMYMRDIAGRPIYATDEVAGYGLSHPSFAYPVWGFEEQQPGANSGATVTMCEGSNFMYNPVWWVRARLRLGHTIVGTSSVSFFLEISQGASVIATSSTQTESVTGNIFAIRNFSRVCVIPANQIGNSLTAKIKVYAGTPTDFNVTMFPLQSCGVSRAFYDYNPALQ